MKTGISSGSQKLLTGPLTDEQKQRIVARYRSVLLDLKRAAASMAEMSGKFKVAQVCLDKEALREIGDASMEINACVFTLRTGRFRVNDNPNRIVSTAIQDSETLETVADQEADISQDNVADEEATLDQENAASQESDEPAGQLSLIEVEQPEW
jgi:hypothetical protein